MKSNKLVIAAAGAGKTTFLVNRACEIEDETVLITTYTEANEIEIKKRLFEKKGYLPANIKIQTWFSFLLQHGVRPYQSVLEPSIHTASIGFYLTNQKSGIRFATKRGPVYWGEDNFYEHYFTKNMEIYSDKLSKFVVKCDDVSKQLVSNRISRIFRNIFIDEIQDLAGYDLEIIKILFQSPSTVLLVGDPRQVTYLTNRSAKYEKYSNGLIKEFVLNELGKKIDCEIDETTLIVSHRNNQMICSYSAKLFPALPIPKACTCRECRETQTDHEGVFVVNQDTIDKYLSIYNPMQLKWDSSSQCNPNYQSMNFGASKGLTFDRVLIYPTADMVSWIKNNKFQLKDAARAKLYVGITRARHSVAFKFDQNDEKINGTELYKNKD
jgi:DNA helicase II / ATP-dependent DNA helicase PcrA